MTISSLGKRRKLSKLEKQCFNRFYFADCGEINACGTDYFKGLGIEKRLEEIMKLAVDHPVIMKVIANDIDNFMVVFDENGNGEFEPIFIMKKGIQEM